MKQKSEVRRIQIILNRFRSNLLRFFLILILSQPVLGRIRATPPSGPVERSFGSDYGFTCMKGNPGLKEISLTYKVNGMDPSITIDEARIQKGQVISIRGFMFFRKSSISFSMEGKNNEGIDFSSLPRAGFKRGLTPTVMKENDLLNWASGSLKPIDPLEWTKTDDLTIKFHSHFKNGKVTSYRGVIAGVADKLDQGTVRTRGFNPRIEASLEALVNSSLNMSKCCFLDQKKQDSCLKRSD